MTSRRRVSFDRRDETNSVKVETAQRLMQTVLKMHEGNDYLWRDLSLFHTLLQRSRDLDNAIIRCNDDGHSNSTVQEQFVLSKTTESGYTPLHRAIFHSDLCQIIYLLRFAAGKDRLPKRPMELLYDGGSANLGRLIATAVDNEGYTSAQLLASLQRNELAACRDMLTRKTKVDNTVNNEGRRSRSNSLFDQLSDENVVENDQNEFDILSRAMRSIQQQQRRDDSSSNAESSTDATTDSVQYGCEVFTFGRAHHCALGVVASSGRRCEENDGKALRPQRVQTFAQEIVGRDNSAVAVAGATHHTLTVNAAGELWSFGLGKGGRLGTGDERPCATPVRVEGPLLRERVLTAAAAENHSLCVTASGHVYAFGSNRFGQLGIVSADNVNSRSSPRRVDDLKQVFCIAVAAGLKHSVALSKNGEVYVWGDNGAGQLGITGRSSNNNSHHKVQRVEALWKGIHGPKKAIAVAASERSTLALVPGSPQRGLAVNTIFAWGHGNHVPCRVQFGLGRRGRPVNPIAVASARYHNVAVTSDGEVYSWGLHADSLGNSSRRKNSDPLSSTMASLSAPKLVSGMLPENGGGIAVAVSASENHTAIVTDLGHLYTWGETSSKNILGHEGVRWQPDPKRVPGVHRAVSVSAAKEHTVLLIGTSFPPIPCETKENEIPSLEVLSARRIAEHIDLFNIIPILVTAERTQTRFLLQYCKEFVRRNLDGILNVGQKAAMDCYVNEQLLGYPLQNTVENDIREYLTHPLATTVALAGSFDNLSFGKERLCSSSEWIDACEQLSRKAITEGLVRRYQSLMKSGPDTFRQGLQRRSSSISELSGVSEEKEESALPSGQSGYSGRCEDLTSDLDFSTKDLAEAKLACLSKEVRAIRKRLSQISKLENCREGVSSLTPEQKQKIARRPQLEADLQKFEPAIQTVERRLQTLEIAESEQRVVNEQESSSIKEKSDVEKEKIDSPCRDTKETVKGWRCGICNVSCPDEKSFELHISGRKHRNRLSHAQDEESKRAAMSVAKEQQKEMMLISSAVMVQKSSPSSPWNKPDSVQPKFKLPPPPHPVQETVACGPRVAVPIENKSFREIMAEQSSKNSCEKSKQHLKLPKGSASPMKSPPWSNAKRIDVPVAPVVMRTEPRAQENSSHSLGDFMPTPPPRQKAALNTPSPRQKATSSGWGSSTTSVARDSATTSVSFASIQQQEQEFKSKQDQTFGSNSKWFIERRERAGSFKEIQSETFEKEEHQRLVDEQIEIERQIYAEIAAKKAEEEKKLKSLKKKRRPRKKGDVKETNKSESTAHE